MNIEDQLERYGRELAARERAGNLLDEPSTVGSDLPQTPEAAVAGSVTAGSTSSGPVELAPEPRPYVDPPRDTGPRFNRRRRMVCAVGAAVVAVVAGAFWWRDQPTNTSVDDPTETTSVVTVPPPETTTTTSVPPTTGGPLAPYPLPPATATDVRGLVQGDVYAMRYRSGDHEYMLLRSSASYPPGTESRALAGFLDGRGERIEGGRLGEVWVTCGDSGDAAEGEDWRWETAAVTYWIQDGYQVSLGLIGSAPQVSFDQDGNVVGPDAGRGCPEPRYVVQMEAELAQLQAVDRAGLDAALDSMPLTIGKLGRNIAPPRSS